MAKATLLPRALVLVLIISCLMTHVVNVMADEGGVTSTTTSGARKLLSVKATAMAQGFGCPFNAYECHSHCRSIGRLGGYCGNYRMTCYCYKN